MTNWLEKTCRTRAYKILHWPIKTSNLQVTEITQIGCQYAFMVYTSTCTTLANQNSSFQVPKITPRGRQFAFTKCCTGQSKHLFTSHWNHTNRIPIYFDGIQQWPIKIDLSKSLSHWNHTNIMTICFHETIFKSGSNLETSLAFGSKYFKPSQLGLLALIYYSTIWTEDYCWSEILHTRVNELLKK